MQPFFRWTANDALDFQAENENLNPDSDADCSGFGSSNPSCVFTNTPQEVAQHHATCQAEGGVSVEFENIIVACTAQQDGNVITFDFTWDVELFCFLPNEACEVHQDTFCTEWVDGLATIRQKFLEDEDFVAVECMPVSGSDNCTLIVDPLIPVPQPTRSPTSEPTAKAPPTASPSASLTESPAGSQAFSPVATTMMPASASVRSDGLSDGAVAAIASVVALIGVGSILFIGLYLYRRRIQDDHDKSTYLASQWTEVRSNDVGPSAAGSTSGTVPGAFFPMIDQESPPVANPVGFGVVAESQWSNDNRRFVDEHSDDDDDSSEETESDEDDSSSSSSSSPANNSNHNLRSRDQSSALL